METYMWCDISTNIHFILAFFIWQDLCIVVGSSFSQIEPGLPSNLCSPENFGEYILVKSCIHYQFPHSKLLQNLEVWNNKRLLSHTSSNGQEPGSCLAGWLWLRVFCEVAVKLSVKAVVSEDLTGAKGFASKLTHGCWQEALVPYYVGFS